MKFNILLAMELLTAKSFHLLKKKENAFKIDISAEMTSKTSLF